MAASTNAAGRSTKPPERRHILITGASSGLGAALARAYASSSTQLTLSGRNIDRLNQVGDTCRALDAEVHIDQLDVQDEDASRTVIEAAWQQAPIDLLIANAGISGAVTGRTDRQDIIRTNLLGVMNTIEPAVPLMRSRGEGQIAIIASLAGFRGMPPAPAYSASKAGARIYGEAMRPLLRPDGIAVSVICPGFVKTPLTAKNPFPMPMLMSAEKAAQIIVKGLERRQARIAFPWPVYWTIRLLSSLPPSVGDWLLGRFEVKEGS